VHTAAALFDASVIYSLSKVGNSEVLRAFLAPLTPRRGCGGGGSGDACRAVYGPPLRIVHVHPPPLILSAPSPHLTPNAASSGRCSGALPDAPWLVAGQHTAHWSVAHGAERPHAPATTYAEQATLVPPSPPSSPFPSPSPSRTSCFSPSLAPSSSPPPRQPRPRPYPSIRPSLSRPCPPRWWYPRP